MSKGQSNTPVTIIKPKPKWSLIDLKEIWDYRELFFVFTLRDLKIRYRQTILGVLYVIFQPLVSMVVFTIFFGNLAKIPSGNLPYSIFVMIGLVFWNFFSGSLSRASNSMLENEEIITKVYFPKVILPLSAIFIFFVDFIINFIVLLLFAAVLGYIPNWTIFIILPLSIILTAITATGIGLFLASINVKYRDVRNILPYLIQIMLFLSPIIYPISIMSARNRYIMALNPITSVVEAMRQVYSKNFSLNPSIMFISIMSSITLLFIGLWYFRRTEQYFSDIV